MENDPIKKNNTPQRLCSEIQLFDLCDLDSCGYKTGRFCSNQDMVSRFEEIAEEELRPPQLYIDEESDYDEETEEYGFDEYEFTDGEESEPEHEN